MAIAFASWVHGTAVVPQGPATASEGKYQVQPYGWGTEVSGTFGVDTARWFQFPMPTPVIIADKRPRLSKVMVRFKGEGAYVRKVHAWDGDKRIGKWDGFSDMADVEKVVSPPAPVMEGLVISVEVVFMAAAGTSDKKKVVFHSVGADFAPA